jgi:hypothetical protein
VPGFRASADHVSADCNVRSIVTGAVVDFSLKGQVKADLLAFIKT